MSVSFSNINSILTVADCCPVAGKMTRKQKRKGDRLGKRDDRISELGGICLLPMKRVVARFPRKEKNRQRFPVAWSDVADMGTSTSVKNQIDNGACVDEENKDDLVDELMFSDLESDDSKDEDFASIFQSSLDEDCAESMTATSGFGIPFTESTTAGTEVMTTSSPAIQVLASSSVTAAVENLFTESTTAGGQVTQIVSSRIIASVEVETETTTTSG
jgi:hypothetical protein